MANKQLGKFSNWGSFISDNPKIDALDEKWEVIMNQVIDTNIDSTSNFTKLTRSPALLLLTQDSFGGVQASFSHDFVGDAVEDDTQSAVSLMGFGTQATPVNKVFEQIQSASRKWFSTMDVKSAFFSIPYKEGSNLPTTFFADTGGNLNSETCENDSGRYVYKRLIMGAQSSSATLERAMENT